MRRLFVLAALLLALPAHAVTIDWVTVGDPGNACDPQFAGCFGAVSNVYRISQHETTNAQYAEFLNAVAETDTYDLYHMNMGSGYGGITRSGSSGSYTYSAIAGREDMPVNYVTFYDALRFANWLHNGQGSGDTETGAYSITAEGVTNNSITRNADATIFLTNDDEWYKAAYFDGTSYFDYPAGTDTQPVCAAAGTTANTANCDSVVDDLTEVGSYTGSPSPHGTFDQGGNLWEWNETKITTAFRGVRGGAFVSIPSTLAGANRGFTNPAAEGAYVGFRVAMIPEPSTALLLASGLAGLAAAGQRRRS
jgi:formylglycine-generating enzyme required for sulfatase activity